MEDHWDFYLGEKYDNTASVALNFGFAEEEPPDGHDALYIARITMKDPDEHGLGSGEEGDTLNAVEDALGARAKDFGLLQIGRIRQGGLWDVSFMGPEKREEELRSALAQVLEPHGHESETAYIPDDGWRYYNEFLYPDAERIRWMQDRDVVMQLREHGDTLAPRVVDHFVDFEQREARDVFARQVAALGFECSLSDEEGYSIQASREDAVDLETIHEIVMQLSNIASEHGGEYDGWGAVLVTDD